MFSIADSRGSAHRLLAPLGIAALLLCVAGLCGAAGPINHRIPNNPPGKPGVSRSSTHAPDGASPVQQTGDPRKTSEGDGPPIAVTCVGAQVPASAHVSAVVTPQAGAPADATPLALQCRYEWDFGDPAGRWNRLPGWNAAHIYDVPGKYIITLTVTEPSGKVTHRTTWLRVAPDQRRKVYVSADGNDAMDGATPARAVRSASRAFHLGANDADVFFRRGDIFDIVAPILISGQGVHVGNYAPAEADPRRRAPQAGPVGAAGLPILRKAEGAGKQWEIFVTGAHCRDLLFEGLEFDSVWDLKSHYGTAKVPARAFGLSGTNIAIRGCAFRNLSDGVNADRRPTGVLLEDCVFFPEMRAYGYYGTGSDHVIVGNVMTHSRQEHLIRCSEPGVNHLLIAYNDLSRPNNVKGSIELRDANWFYVADNHIDGGTLRVGPQDKGMDQAKFPDWPNVKCTWGVVEDNRLDHVFVQVRLGSEHIMVRNNTIRQDDALWSFLVACEQPGWDEVRHVIDLTIEHNTAIITGPRGYFLFVQGKPIGLTVRDNLFVAPRLGTGGANAGAIYATRGLDGFTGIEGNVYPPGPGGTQFLSKAAVSRGAWTSNPLVKGDRYQAVPLDADDNPPAALGAGAKLGHDKRDRMSNRTAGR